MLKSSYLGYQCKIRGFCDQDMFTMISLFRSSSVQSRRVMINILPKPPTAIKSFNSIKLAGNLSKSETTLLSHCFEADKKISCCKKEGNNWKLYKTIRSTLLEEKLLQTPHRELGRGWFHVLRFFRVFFPHVKMGLKILIEEISQFKERASLGFVLSG